MAVGDGRSKTDQLTTLFNERIKTHYAYDGQNRLWKTWEASVETSHGAPCLLTEYAFINGVDPEVVGFKETVGVWDEAWDSVFST